MTDFLPFAVPALTGLIAFFGGIYAARRKSDTEDFKAIIQANTDLREEFKEQLEAARAEIEELRKEVKACHETIDQLRGELARYKKKDF